MTVYTKSKNEQRQVGNEEFSRIEDKKILTVGGTYVADLEFEETHFVHFVRSYISHGIIKSIDVSSARDMSGVVDVITANEIALDPLVPAKIVDQGMVRELLPKNKVRYSGEPIVVIIAKSKQEAAKAAELVEIDIEPLNPLINIKDSLASNELIFDGAKSNVASENLPTDFNEDDFFSDCEIVVEDSYVIPKVAPCPLEGRAIIAKPTLENLEIYISTQAPHSVKDTLSKMLKIDSSLIHVIAKDVGGGFGAKIGIYPEEMLVAYLAKKYNMTLKWVETRTESMLALGHGRGQTQRAKLGGTREGKFTHYYLEVLQDCGAYPLTGAFLPIFTRFMTSGTYDIKNVEYKSRSVITNTNPVVAYRGAGRPEATYAIERIVDKFARQIQVDPVELRLLNFIKPDQFPYQTKFGAIYDTGEYEKTLRALIEKSNLAELVMEKSIYINSDSRFRIGVGISSYVEITHGIPSLEYGSAQLNPDGNLELRCGTFSHGQGHLTSFANIASEITGISVHNIKVIQGDTDLVPFGVGTFGSRSIQSGGVAINRATLNLVEKIRQFLADYTNSSLENVSFSKLDGYFSCGSGNYTFNHVAQLAYNAGVDLKCEAEYKADAPTFPFGSHLAQVKVDLDTCQVTLMKVVTVDDAGNIINPLLAMGQLHGGIAQGASEALFEEVIYDSDGNLMTSTLYDYGFPSATEFPRFEVNLSETPTPINELGAKGIGESGTIGIIPAVANAVVDALSEFGIVNIDIPITPVKIYNALYGNKSS